MNLWKRIHQVFPGFAKKIEATKKKEPDRQTDRQMTDKATYWSITAYNDEIEVLENTTSYPPWVAKVYGGREECPKTGTIHFQGCVQAKAQVRFSQVKKWLPTAHIEAARSELALQKYAMKESTAVGEKVVRKDTREWWPMERSLVELAQACDVLGLDKDYYREVMDDPKSSYWNAVKVIIRKQPWRITQFANPALEKAWVNTYRVWLGEETRAIVLQPAECAQRTEEKPEE